MTIAISAASDDRNVCLIFQQECAKLFWTAQKDERNESDDCELFVHCVCINYSMLVGGRNAFVPTLFCVGVWTRNSLFSGSYCAYYFINMGNASQKLSTADESALSGIESTTGMDRRELMKEYKKFKKQFPGGGIDLEAFYKVR